MWIGTPLVEKVDSQGVCPLRFWEHTLQHFDYSSELGYDAEEQ